MKKIGLIITGLFMSLMFLTSSCGTLLEVATGASQGYNAAEHG